MKKRILFVTNTLGCAGAERALIALLGTLKNNEKNTLEIYLYVLLEQGELACELPEYIRLCSRNYSTAPVYSRAGKIHRIKRCLRIPDLRYIISNFMRMKRENNINIDKLLWRLVSDSADRFRREFDIAVAWLEGGSTYYVADHVRAKEKIAFVHVDYEQAGYTRDLDLDCYEHFDRICAVSKSVKKSFLKVHPECRYKTKIVPNILDKERIKRLAKSKSGFHDGFTGFRIVSVGRLTEQKDYLTSIRAMELLKENGKNVRWHVIGEGPMRSALEKEIRRAGLTEDFILEGQKDNPYPYIKNADMFAQLSRYEGKSIAAQEALFLGIPVLASDTESNRGLSGDEGEVILCSRDKKAICEAIIKRMSYEK